MSSNCNGYLIINRYYITGKFRTLYAMFKAAFVRYGMRVESLDNAECAARLDSGTLAPADFVLFWDKDVVLAKRLENKGYRLFNSAEAISICDDKAFTFAALEGSGIPMPITLVAPFTYENIGYKDYDFLRSVERRLSYPMVVKAARGSFGDGVFLVRTYEELVKITEQIAPKQMLFQQYVSESYGRDVRVQVVGDKVIACAIRENAGDFRANVTGGGTMRAYTPPKDFCDVALAVCKVLKTDFCGVDIMFGKQGAVFCEANSNAHFVNLYTATGINVADSIAEYIIATVGK